MSTRRAARFVAGLAASLAFAAAAAPTPVRVIPTVPALAGLADCLASQARASGPVSEDARMVDGIEFRLILRVDRPDQALVIINSVYKPDIDGLIAAQEHDDHPEAQSAAAIRFYRHLRVPLGSRAWLWRDAEAQAICREAGRWLTEVRKHPILFDRLGPDGEMHAP